MREIVRGLLAAAVCSGLIFATACGDGGDVVQEVTAMGRYVETEMEMPEGELERMHLLPGGKVNIHAFVNNGGERERAIYQTVDFQSWERQDLLPEGKDPSYLSNYGFDGRAHFLISENKEGSTEQGHLINRVYRELDGGFEDMIVDWRTAPFNSDFVSADGLWVLANGDYIVQQNFDGLVVQYSGDGTFKYEYGINSYRTPVTVSGNKIYIVDMETAAMSVYDGETGLMADEVRFENYTYSTRLFAGQNGAVYMQNNSGLYRLISDGSIWEKIIDGDLNSMSMPTLDLDCFIETEDGSFYCIASNGYAEYHILRYHYDPDAATLPGRELVVYMLGYNDTVRQAAVVFQKQNPDIKVNIQVAESDDSIAKSDLLQVLDTEIVAGKGPDVLILDDMNVESYIEKGALMDITDVITEAAAGREMIETVLQTCEQDGRLYAVPANFRMPVMVLQESHAAVLTNLADLARFARENPEKSLIGDLRPENLVATFLPVSASTWIQDGAIDTEQLAEFLASIKTIAQSGQSHHGSQTERMDISSEAVLYAFGRTHAMPYYTDNMGNMLMIHIAMEECAGSTLVHLPGQQEKTFIPVTIAGVNANSASPEMAKEFMKVLLSDEVQRNSRYTGYPISVSALDKLAADELESKLYGVAASDVADEILLGVPPTAEQQQILAQLAREVENPATVDEELIETVTEAAQGYFVDSKNLDQTVADVEEAVKLLRIFRD